MTKDEMKNRISMAIKDPILQQGFEIICKENEKLKAKYGCPNCASFGKHCPHKVNGDPYFYDCYLTVEELEKENEELKEEMNAKQVVLNDFKSRVETVTGRFNKKSSQLTKAKEIILKFLDAKNIEDTCVAESEAEHFLQELS